MIPGAPPAVVPCSYALGEAADETAPVMPSPSKSPAATPAAGEKEASFARLRRLGRAPHAPSPARHATAGQVGAGGLAAAVRGGSASERRVGAQVRRGRPRVLQPVQRHHRLPQVYREPLAECRRHCEGVGSGDVEWRGRRWWSRCGRPRRRRYGGSCCCGGGEGRRRSGSSRPRPSGAHERQPGDCCCRRRRQVGHRVGSGRGARLGGQGTLEKKRPWTACARGGSQVVVPPAAAAAAQGAPAALHSTAAAAARGSRWSGRG